MLLIVTLTFDLKLLHQLLVSCDICSRCNKFELSMTEK